MLAAPICPAQEDDGMGPPDGGDGMGRAFGRGNGVRGTVTAAGASSFTIRTDEGDTYQVLYSPNTRLVKDRQPIAAADVHVGDMLMAGGLVDAKAKTVGAVIVVDIDAKEVRNARAAFGKTWVVGKVTAIHELKITIERAGDKQSQIVAVDENTSFRKRREDVTLADVKVGDMISAQGALHDGHLSRHRPAHYASRCRTSEWAWPASCAGPVTRKSERSTKTMGENRAVKTLGAPA